MPKNSISCLALTCLGLLSWLGCGRKRLAEKDLASWLATHFPGQFEILETKSRASLKNWNFDQFNVLLVQKSDPEIQFFIHWDRALENGGAEPEVVKQNHTRAISQIAKGRLLKQALEKQGLKNFKTGYEGGYADVCVYGTSATEREKSLEQIFESFHGLPDISHVSVYWMDPGFPNEDFKELIPPPLVAKRTQWRMERCLYYLEIDSLNTRTIADLKKSISVNRESHQALNTYGDAAYAQALDWATKNLKDSIHLERYEGAYDEPCDADLLLIKYSFPYCRKSDLSAEGTCDGKYAGIITGIYHPETHKLDKIQRGKYQE